jgi:hypothetical protein
VVDKGRIVLDGPRDEVLARLRQGAANSNAGTANPAATAPTPTSPPTAIGVVA